MRGESIFLLCAILATGFTLLTCFEQVVEYDIQMTTPGGLISDPYKQYWSHWHSSMYLHYESSLLRPSLATKLSIFQTEIALSYIRAVWSLFSWTRLGSAVIFEFIFQIFGFLIGFANQQAIESAHFRLSELMACITFFLYFCGKSSSISHSIVLGLVFMLNISKAFSQPKLPLYLISFWPRLTYILYDKFYNVILLLFLKRTFLHVLAFTLSAKMPDASALLLSWNSYAYYGDYDYEILKSICEFRRYLNFTMLSSYKKLRKVFVVQQLLSFGVFVFHAKQKLLQLPLMWSLIPFIISIFIGKATSILGSGTSRPCLEIGYFFSIPVILLPQIIQGSRTKYEKWLSALQTSNIISADASTPSTVSTSTSSKFTSSFSKTKELKKASLKGTRKAA